MRGHSSLGLSYFDGVCPLENLRFCFDILRSVTRPDESLHEFLSSYAPDPEIFARKLNFPPTDESDDLRTHGVLHLARMVIPQTNNFIRARWMDTLAILVRQVSKFSYPIVLIYYVSQYESQDPLFHKNIATRWQEWFRILYDAEESGPALDRRTLKPVCCGFPFFDCHLHSFNILKFSSRFHPHRKMMHLHWHMLNTIS